MVIDIFLVYERKGNVFKDTWESSLYQISIINKILCPFLKELTTSLFFVLIFFLRLWSQKPCIKHKS